MGAFTYVYGRAKKVADYSLRADKADKLFPWLRSQTPADGQISNSLVSIL